MKIMGRVFNLQIKKPLIKLQNSGNIIFANFFFTDGFPLIFAAFHNNKLSF